MDKNVKNQSIVKLSEAIQKVSTMKPAPDRPYVNDRLREVRETIKAEPVDEEAPAPQPPKPPDSTGTYGGYSAANMPPANWRAGDSTSPFNKPIDRSKVHAKSQAKVDWLCTFDDDDAARGPMDMVIWDRSVVAKSGAHAICWAKPTDPEFTIRQRETWFPNNTGQKVRIPKQAEPGQDGYDYQLACIQPDGTTWDLYKTEKRNPDGGDVWCRACGKGKINGDLIADYGEATQGHMDLIAGMIRGEQMVAGKINHALFLVVPGSARSGYFVSPVPVMGGKPAAPAGGTDKIDVGQRLFLNYSAAEIDGLALKPWEKVIYKALAEYGGYVGDGGGSPSALMSIQAISGSSYAPFGVPDPWVNYAKQFAGVYNGSYVLRWSQGVIDWRNRLKVAP